MQKSKSALFLMELIIVIFFFALTSAVCLQVFVRAHNISKRTEELNGAVLWADNACECFYEYGDDEAAIRGVLEPAFDVEGYGFELTFSHDEDFRYMTFDYIEKATGETVYTYSFKQNIKEVAH